MSILKILVADDHAVLRLGLKIVLNSQFKDCEVDEAEDSVSLFASLQTKTYTHLILDLQLKDINMIDVFAEIRSLFPTLQILIYSMNEEAIYAQRLIQLGASGFLNKQANRAKLIRTLQIFFHDNFNSSTMYENISRSSSNSNQLNPFDKLSSRETIVLKSILLGKKNKEISNECNLKPTTIATYKSRIYHKLGYSNLMDIRRLAEVYKFIGINNNHLF